MKDKLLIIRLSSLGDIIHTFPIPYLIKKHYKDIEVHWIAEKAYHELIALNPYVDIIHDINIRALKKDCSKAQIYNNIKIIRALRANKYKYSFDFQGNIKSGVISRLIKASRRIGFSKNACQESLNPLFNNQIVHIDNNTDLHIIEKNIRQLEMLEIYDNDIHFPINLKNDIRDELKYFIIDIKKRTGPIIGITLSAGFETKILSEYFYFSLIESIIQDHQDSNILLFWGPGEYETAKGLYNSIGSEAKKRVYILPPTSIIESFYFIDICSVFIGSDTGPLHIADALKKNVIGIYTSTSPEKTGPYNNRENTVRTKVVCAPCFKRKCSSRICRDDIRIEEILQKIKTLL